MEQPTKKILFIAYNAGRGGASRVMSLLQNECAARGYEVTYMVRDIFQAYELDKSIRIIELGKEKQFNKLFFIKRVRAFSKEQKVDAVVSFLLVPNLINILACRGLTCKSVISERNDPVSYPFGMKCLIRLMYRFADSIVFQTERARSFYPKAARKKGIIIRNPISVAATATEPKPRIVSVGRLEEQKNQRMLIRCFAKILRQHPEYELTIYGEGNLRSELEKSIAELNLTGKVTLPGNVPDVHKRMADAELFVLPSRYEGLSNALLEAMMMGIPCISTNCAGSDEIIENGVNGLLVPIDDEERLYEAMEQMINDRSFRERAAAAAKDTVKELEVATIVERWLSVIL